MLFFPIRYGVKSDTEIIDENEGINLALSAI